MPFSDFLFMIFVCGVLCGWKIILWHKYVYKRTFKGSSPPSILVVQKYHRSPPPFWLEIQPRSGHFWAWKEHGYGDLFVLKQLFSAVVDPRFPTGRANQWFGHFFRKMYEIEEMLIKSMVPFLNFSENTTFLVTAPTTIQNVKIKYWAWLIR